MRAIVSLPMILCVAFALSACGNEGGSGKKKNVQQKAGTTELISNPIVFDYSRKSQKDTTAPDLRVLWGRTPQFSLSEVLNAAQVTLTHAEIANRVGSINAKGQSQLNGNYDIDVYLDTYFGTDTSSNDPLDMAFRNMDLMARGAITLLNPDTIQINNLGLPSRGIRQGGTAYRITLVFYRKGHSLADLMVLIPLRGL